MTEDKLKLPRIGQRFKTQDNRWAYLIAIDCKLERPLVFRVGDKVWTRQINGKHCDKCDGFDSYEDMYNFFCRDHGRHTFNRFVILWNPKEEQ